MLGTCRIKVAFAPCQESLHGINICSRPCRKVSSGQENRGEPVNTSFDARRRSDIGARAGGHGAAAPGGQGRPSRGQLVPYPRGWQI